MGMKMRMRMRRMGVVVLLDLQQPGLMMPAAALLGLQKLAPFYHSTS